MDRTVREVCAEQLAELEQWAIDQVGEPIWRCGTCHPARDALRSISTKRTERTVARPVPEGRSEIHGPAAGSAVVQAWADDYIRFERRPAWQEHLRTEIRTRCRQLEPSAGQVLHATFFGAKHSNADVENLALYYIDSFRIAGRNGSASSSAPLCRRLPMAPSIRSATATRSRRGRAPSPNGSSGERWRRSTGPTWARSLARSSWHRFGWRSPAARSR